jgi:hypothetical protein
MLRDEERVPLEVFVLRLEYGELLAQLLKLH